MYGTMFSFLFFSLYCLLFWKDSKEKDKGPGSKSSLPCIWCDSTYESSPKKKISVRRFVMVHTVYVKMFEVSLSRYGIKSSKGYFHPRQLIALVTKPITAPPPTIMIVAVTSIIIDR
jgi:hypothetical protein